MGRFARTVMARASSGSVAVTRLWPGRTDRLIIAPDLIEDVHTNPLKSLRRMSSRQFRSIYSDI